MPPSAPCSGPLFPSSETGIATPAEMAHYGMTKTAFLAASRGLSETVAGSGVTVNAVLPGPTASEGVEQFVKDLARDGKMPEQVEQEFFTNMWPTSLIKRFETVEVIDNVCVFLAANQVSAGTGTVARFDGGVVRSVI